MSTPTARITGSLPLPVRYVKGILFTSMLVVLVVLPHVLNRYELSLAYTVLFYIVLTSALNIHSGYTGYINFGFALFVGIGMYVTALGIVEAGLPFWMLWPLGGIVATAIAAIISYPLLRVRGVYFSIAILAIAEGTRALISLPPIDSYTHGGSGISFFVDVSLSTHYYAMALMAVAVVGLTYLISTSRFGRQLLAIRDNERVVESLGINPESRKVATFLISSLFAGTAGSINATYLLYIDPAVGFNLNYTIEPVAMAMIGGFGTVWGPVIGAVGIKLTEQILWSQFLSLNRVFFGVVVIVGVLLVPSGIIRKAQHSGIISWSRKW